MSQKSDERKERIQAKGELKKAAIRAKSDERKAKIQAKRSVLHAKIDAAKETDYLACLDIGFSKIKLYADGTITHKGVGGSVVGASAEITQTGSKRLVRDTRQSFITITGPDISLSKQLPSNKDRTVRQAREFASQVNSLSMRLTEI